MTEIRTEINEIGTDKSKWEYHDAQPGLLKILIKFISP